MNHTDDQLLHLELVFHARTGNHELPCCVSEAEFYTGLYSHTLSSKPSHKFSVE